MIKRLLIAGVGLFVAYEFIRIFMIGVTWGPWTEPRTFLAKDSRGTFEITFFPDYRFLTRSSYENGSCIRGGRIRGSMGRPVAGRLYYVDCPGLIKFHVIPAMTEVACVELETVREEGRGCMAPNVLAQMAKPTVFYRVMGFSDDGSAAYDAGDLLRRVSNPDTTNPAETIERLAPLNDRGR